MEEKVEIIIDEAVLAKFPETQIGYIVGDVVVSANEAYVEKLKEGLGDLLQERGFDATTFVTHPNVAIWREIYQNEFKVKPKAYRSSLEALLKRVIAGKSIWNISSVVDLYNCCSVISLCPMGGYDLDMITGNITIRYGREGETFVPLGTKEAVTISENHIIYADEERTLCWLWNHKDTKTTAITEDTRRVIFFIDGFSEEAVQRAIDLLENHLPKIQCKTVLHGILSAKNRAASLLMTI